MRGASSASASLAARRDWDAKSRKVEAAGAAAVASGAGNNLYLPRLSEIVHAHAREHTDVRAHGLSRIFCLPCRLDRIFRRKRADLGAFHAHRWIAAGGRDGHCHLEGTLAARADHHGEKL